VSAMRNKGEVYFMLFGEDFDPETVSRELGVSPSRTRIKADPTPRKSMWIYSKGEKEHELIDIYAMASSVVSDLQPYAEKIGESMRKHNLDAVLEVVLEISVDDSISTPAIGFDKNVIEFLSKIGASIDIDTYRRVG